MSREDRIRPDAPPSVPASRAPDQDATAAILRRLQAHGSRESRYQSRGEVARGGMGMIVRVWDEDLRRELAMKVVLGPSGAAATGEIPPKVLGRFLEEAQVTGQLDHPGIVPVHELGLDDRGGVFFTMRLVRGRDLKEVFDLVHGGDPEWTQTRTLWALLKVCDAMAYAHSKGVIHRDLKPANVMVGRFGEVYVMDWGLARVVGQPDRHDLRLRRDETSLTIVESERRADASHSADSVLFTMDGDVVGTPAYMAPEQARGEIERLGPRSDVYSTGAMLYHLLTGQMPFVTPGAKFSQHMVLRWTLEGPPQPIRELAPDVPDELVAICEKAMAREPEQRYADMGALAEDLRAYLENRVVKAHATGAWTELKKWVQRNRALAGAWLAAGLAALLGLAATLAVEVRGRNAADSARERAEASESAAQANLIEARRQEEIARRERANVLRLSAFQVLDDLEREAERLWPALPAHVGAYEDWLRRAERLVGGLEPSPDGTDTGHRRQLADLQLRARTLSAEERQRLVAAHPRGLELLRADQQVAALRAAAAVRGGQARVPEPALDPAMTGLDANALNERAWPLIDPDRTALGREAEGLALARAALERVEPDERAAVLDTLSWALLANGLDGEALEASRAALEAAPPARLDEFEEYVSRVARAVQGAAGAGSRAALDAAEERRASLEREVLGPRARRFENEDDVWWASQLEKLVDALERFADPEHGLVRGVAAGHGWGIERRLAFARGVEQRTRTSPRASEAWRVACASIRDRDECPLYGGLELEPELGLLPLGRDPDSGLWEFGELQTGEPPERGPDGRLRLGPESGVVFVLLPGGMFSMGAQAQDPALPNFDPLAGENEAPLREVRLAPFFVSKYELTQGQWRRFTGENPSKYLAGTYKAGRALDELAPVEQVSWRAAQAQLARLGWKLPTEAQWEYAARGGVDAPWWTGETPGSLAEAANLSDRFARDHGAPWSAFEPELDDGHLVQAPAGSFEANPFGLHDVLGNVYEWCRDEYQFYGLGVAEGDGERLGGDPGLRVARGGAFVTPAKDARSAKRDTAPPELQNEAIGLRPVRALRR